MSPFIVIHGCLRICFNDGRVSGLIYSIFETRSLASVETRIRQTQKIMGIAGLPFVSLRTENCGLD